MNPEDLQPASYRGVEFLATSTVTSGGRKLARKQFVNSDLQIMEDLGILQRDFSVSGVVAARRSNDGTTEIQSYQAVRDALLQALEEGGPGVLVHPFFGRVENLVAVTYSFSESTSQLGNSPIDITFAVSNTDGLPKAQPSVLAEVVTAVSSSVAASTADVGDRFSDTGTATGNFTDSNSKIQGMITAVEKATRPAAVLVDELDAFDDLLTSFSRDATMLVSEPEDLATRTTAMFTQVDTLYSRKRNTFDAFVRLFTFGDDDVAIPQTTAGRIERQKNRNVVNDAVQSQALSYAYLNGVQLDFATTQDIDAVALVLEDQYQKMIASGTLDSGVEEELTKLRITSTNFFNAQRVTKPRIIQVRTNPTSTRLLSYRYYGNSDLGNDIARLNGLDDAAFIEGQVEVLSA